MMMSRWRSITRCTLGALLVALVGSTSHLSADEPEQRVWKERRHPHHEIRRVVVLSDDAAPHSILSLSGRGYLGVEVQRLTRELRAHFGAPTESGLLVSRVEEESPAAAAGIAVGDVLVSIDGEPLVSTHDLRRIVRAREAGDPLDIDAVRKRSSLRFEAIVSERERTEVDLLSLLPTEAIDLGAGHTTFDLDVESAIEIDGERFELGPSELGGALEALREVVLGPQWEGHLRVLQEEGDPELEDRMAELEARLEELRAQIEALAEEE